MTQRTFTIIVSSLLVFSFAPVIADAQNKSDFPNSKQIRIGSQNVKMVKTGQAVRKKLIFSVYAVANYVQDNVNVRTAEDVINTDCPKVLHLVMFRTVSGENMANSLIAILRKNHPAPAFANETKALAALIRSGSAEKGDHILLTHIPQVGLHFKHVGGREILIRNVVCSRAIWEIYFGRNNVSEDVKKGLLSQVQK